LCERYSVFATDFFLINLIMILRRTFLSTVGQNNRFQDLEILAARAKNALRSVFPNNFALAPKGWPPLLYILFKSLWFC
jgi:hypothetical protein